MYNILCAGCSFTKCDWLPKGNTFGGYSYSDFLPEKAYNIGVPGAGITKHLIESFVRENKDIELTHFIYQVPSPARQPIDLNDNDMSSFNLQHTPGTPAIRVARALPRPDLMLKRLTRAADDQADPRRGELESKDIKVLIKEMRRNSRRSKKSNPNNVWNILTKLDFMKSKSIMKIFNDHQKYLDKALHNVDINVKFIRERYPSVKMIFFRYETTNAALLYEFCMGFYKTMLTDYCKENNITYIYEENFNTTWFKRNSLTTDSVHPNKAGAELIADKIKEHI